MRDFPEESDVRETPVAGADFATGSFMRTPSAAFLGRSMSSGSNIIWGSAVVNKETFEAAKAERAALRSELNNLKHKHLKTKAYLSYETGQRRTLVATANSYKNEFKEMEADMNGLRQMLEQRTKTAEPLKRKKLVTIIEDLDVRYVRIGSEILLRMHIYCQRRACELDPFADWELRRWELRSEKVEHCGVQTRYGTMIAPFPPNLFARGAR